MINRRLSQKILVKILLYAIWAVGLLIAGVKVTQAQNGDQMLDGIGETAMMARYVLNGDVKDWSRNNLHGHYTENAVTFVNNARFGQVLSLSGQPNAFITLPAAALTDFESLSIAGWIYLRSTQPGQCLFDFGPAPTLHLFTAPVGTPAQPGFQAAIATNQTTPQGALAPAIPINQWVHLAVVIDIPAKTMTTYVDGKPTGQTKEIPHELSAVFGKSSTDNHLYLGKSLIPGAPNLNALLHDFRMYRVPLSNTQVAGIYHHALGGLNAGQVNTRHQPEDNLPQLAADATPLYNTYLVSVADVAVETTVGTLPQLPREVPGSYQQGQPGPMVRVLWPAPIDNSEVLKPGQYTVTGRIAGTNLTPKAVVTVKATNSPTAPTINLQPFALSQVTLNANAQGQPTKFIENRDKFINTLATTNPDAFLYMFRHAFGLPQPAGATPLGVWDTKDTKLRGHATGHYLSAIAQAYASTGYDPALQKNFADKMTYMVNTLYELSQRSGKPQTAGRPSVADPAAVPHGPGKTDYDSDLSDEGIRHDYWNWGTGFISAYPPDQFIMLEHGARYGGQTSQIWAPYYTLHKILAGLLDVYEVSGNEKALAIATGMGSWVYARLSQVPTDTLINMWNTYIAGEYGGMNEVMARLYRLTGNANDLKTARLFDNIRVFFGDKDHVHGLAKNVDLFRGLHANQHIPQIVGSIETYRVAHNPEYYQIAHNFWYKTVHDYMYSIGGVAGARNPANAECFTSQPATLYENGFSSGGQNETCATYNMLKLTSDLFCFEQQAAYMDYYERGLYNHILASVAENTPANTYHVPLRPGSIKQFGNPDMTGFTCCNGTAIESSTKLQNTIYFQSIDHKALYVNLYIPSTLQWTDRNITVTQTTNFPKEDHTQLTIQGGGKFDLHVRVPGWATQGFFVTINGKTFKHNATPGSYLKISRKWKDGDVVALKMPFQFHLDPVMDQQNIASLFYGPVLLAAQEPEARNTWRQITLKAKDISQSIQGDPQQLLFTIDGVVFKPFYDTYGRHSVYLDVKLE